MSISFYNASVPVFVQMLGALNEILNKASAHAAAKQTDPDQLLQSRLIEDMFPLLRQVQIACDFARSVPARLAGVEVPSYDDTEQNIAQLQSRIANTLTFIKSLTVEQFTDSGSRQILLRPGTPKERSLSAEAYLLSYGLPQFFFHVTTAYALLRQNGVEIGKRDYMGVY